MNEKSKFNEYVEMSVTQLKENVSKKLDPEVSELINQAKNIFIIGVGSSYNAAKSIQPFMQNSLNKPVLTFLPKVFNDYYSTLDNSIYIVISQSGESKEILTSAQKIIDNNGKIIALTENKDSALANLSNKTVTIHDFKESIPFKSIGFTNTIFQLALMAEINIDFLSNFEKKIDLIKSKTNDSINQFIEKVNDQSRITILSEGIHNGIADELGLKVKEMVWIPSSSYEIEDFMHGKDAYINDKDHVIILNNTQKSSFYKDFSSALNEYKVNDVLIFNNDNSFETSNDLEKMFIYTILVQNIANLLNIKLNRSGDSLRSRNLVGLTKTYG